MNFLKKTNLKNFFKKINEHEIIKQFFALNKIEGFHVVPKESINFSEDLYEFYMSLDEDSKKIIKTEIDKIAFISNFVANKIILFFDKDIYDSVYYTLASTFQEKAMAFYIENERNIANVIDIYSFYKVSGWKRFEFDSLKDLKEEDFDNVCLELSERYKEKYFTDNNVYPIIMDTKIFNYDNKYFSFIDYSEEVSKNIKRIYFVFLKDFGEVLIKTSGGYGEIFSVAEIFVKKLFGEALDMREPEYDLDFLSSNILNSDSNDFFANQNIKDWRAKNFNFSYNGNILSIKLKKDSNSKGFESLIGFVENLNLKTSLYKLESLTIDFTIILNGIESVNKKVSLSIKTNNSNLNLLKEEHLVLSKVLKEKNIFKGFKNIEL